MRRWLNVSRPCYDKCHRCPGWAGGGIHYARVPLCDGGHITLSRDGDHWRWYFGRCDKCEVLVLPNVIRYVDPANLLSELRQIPGRVADWRWERRHHELRRSRVADLRPLSV